jgi:molybdenum cofactor biosynthesis enzyme MoaA
MAERWTGTDHRRETSTRRAQKRCRECGSPNIMTVEIAPVAVDFCTECDSRFYTNDGEPVSQEVVFGLWDRTRNA